ncbi:oligosaccharide flippase family protein [Duganella sp. FT135W]|uniref:Oligosaccharide flippase family protein n=1 Tax=Duganella flavida TaxID=2692175 RepID=A0A6L8KHT2_9BURK|nr:O-antigen translocase [Duganella flavida]MYM26675.1 oligosaccharide flippase family protein [Duganella flavida]
MALKRALGWGAAQSVLRMVLGFLSIKITAVYLGPAGLALVGQFGNFFTLMSGAFGTAINTAVVNLTAKAGDDGVDGLATLWGTAMRLALLIGLALCVLVALASQPIAAWLLKDGAYWPAIVAGAASIPLSMAGFVITGGLNGQKRISVLGVIGIVSSLLGSLVFVPLCYWFGVWGGLLAFAVSNCCVLLTALGVLARERTAALAPFGGRWDPAVVRSLWAFFPMLLVHSITEPIAPLMVRDALVVQLGATTAGFWQAALRLSDMYSLVLTTAVSMYLMPHLAGIKDEREFGRELWRTMGKVAGLTAVGALAIYLLRDLVIAIVFTRQFVPVRELLGYLFLGNVLKMAAWPLRMALVIKLRAKWYIVLEIVVAVLQIALTHAWLPLLGAQAATAAYAAAYGLALLVLLYSNKGYLYENWR